MHILIEGESYPSILLDNLFDDPKFYKSNGLEATITSVGYYHSFTKNTLVFMLPKVFMKDNNNTVFNLSKEQLITLVENQSIKHKAEYNWIRQLSVYFYNSIIEYRKRRTTTSISHKLENYELNSNINDKDYSYLDIVLSIINFYKKNKQPILYKHIEFTNNLAKKVKWDNTIRKSLPLMTNNSQPIYTQITNRKKVLNNEEELITYFFSILNKLNQEHQLNLSINKSYTIIKDKKFDVLCSNGLQKLRKIKHRYFSDILIRMYRLCEMYFAQYDTSSIKRKREDFIAISNYNLVFEDMVDKLFSTQYNLENNDGISLEKLKNHDDGKIIDHIYDYQSLIDTSNIFYIGDSKYYKSSSQAGKVSKYKQFTYAKNVIQFNIDLLNDKGEAHIQLLRYRDKITEGYNISPNFFIYGYIDNINNYDEDLIKSKAQVIKSYHFKDRLFDRDTLFVHQYSINFLFVLKSYTTFNQIRIDEFRTKTKENFRKEFISYFNNMEKCGFSFYKANMLSSEYEEFINKHFKILNGKAYITNNNELIIAKHSEDNSLSHIISDKFSPFELS